LKKDIGKLDSNIDSGRGKDELIKKRPETIHQIQKLDRLEALEAAQKAKIKWVIDGTLLMPRLKRQFGSAVRIKLRGQTVFLSDFLGISGTSWMWTYTLR
nr:hypothetical protein [Tanacetum cinerariifolium]